MVLMQARSAAYMGCSGSMASGILLALACSSSVAMPSHLAARQRDVLVRCLAGQRAGQAAHHQHQAGGVQFAGFVDGAAVVVVRGLQAGRIRRGEHAAAAVAGQFQAVGFDEF
jgi:hypothetical protein